MGLPEYASVKISSVRCGRPDCDALVIMPESVMDQFRESHATWYCYRGHPRCFRGQSDKEKLKAELAREREVLARTTRSRNAYKGKLNRVKSRVRNGVCPCCNRTFTNLGRHMQSQHPGFAESEIDA